MNVKLEYSKYMGIPPNLSSLCILSTTILMLVVKSKLSVAIHLGSKVLEAAFGFVFA